VHRLRHAGLDILLARDMGMAPDVQRLFVGHMGCYAALPGWARRPTSCSPGRPGAAALRRADQPAPAAAAPRADIQQIVSHALFSDAAAAVVLTRRQSRGYAVSEVAAVTDSTTADHMTGRSPIWASGWGCRRGAGRARRARPRAGRGPAGPARLTIADVDGWAVHPGGPKILDVVQEQLGLPTRRWRLP
jgi:predicted naringenin-chalcone synthase